MKIWKFEVKDETYIKGLVNIMANHCTFHDLTSTQAYEFHKLMDWLLAFPKALEQAEEWIEPEEQSKQQRIDAAKKLLEDEGYAIATPKTPVKLGPGA